LVSKSSIHSIGNGTTIPAATRATVIVVYQQQAVEEKSQYLPNFYSIASGQEIYFYLFKKVSELFEKVFKPEIKSFPFFEEEESDQGCQMVYFHTKNPNFYIFCKALEWKIWYICGHLVYLWSFGVIFLILVSCTKKIWQP
jgi:hypothetical protein